MREGGSVWKAEVGVEGKGGCKFEIIPDYFPFLVFEYFEFQLGKKCCNVMTKTEIVVFLKNGDRKD